MTLCRVRLRLKEEEKEEEEEEGTAPTGLPDRSKSSR